MKTRSPLIPAFRPRCHSFVPFVLFVVSLAFATVAFAQLPDNVSTAEKITQARVFSQPITWTSDQRPSESQSLALWLAIQHFTTDGVKGGIGALESFIANNSESPWAPSLRAHLGKYYLDRGRYTLALDHWEKAWTAAKNSQAKGGRMAADFALAHWSRLLGSLGRKDTLAALVQETQNRVLSDPVLQGRLNATREGYSRMTADPGIAYRCGTFALDHVGKALKGTNYTYKFGPTEASPSSGFSMLKIMEFSDKAKLDLVPVERRNDAEIVVPSVIHWKQDHYAAIVGRSGDSYKVIDPTFGNPRWFPRESIEVESSGYFMIPSPQIS